MSDAEVGLPEFVMPRKGGGVILGYWDHEKTPALIQDLEHSVCLIEDKCKQLLEELIYYKRCGEESKDLDHRLVRFEVNYFKRFVGAILHPGTFLLYDAQVELRLKDKEAKVKPNSSIQLLSALVLDRTAIKSDITKETSRSLYGSEPDIVQRQNLINFQELQQVFEERFEQKLSGINKELTEVSRKIGLKNNVVLFPTNDYLTALNAQIEKAAQKSWCNNRDKFFKGCLITANAKSESLIKQHGGAEGEFSKITKNELALYQKLSSVKKRKARSRKRRGKAPASRAEKVKLNGKWKILKLHQDLLPGKHTKRKSGKKTCKKREKRRAILQTASCSPHYSRSTVLSLAKLSDAEIERICKLLSESISKKKLWKSRRGRGAAAETKMSAAFTSSSAPLRISEAEDNEDQLQRLRRKSELRISASENIHRGTKKRVFSKSTTLVNKGQPMFRISSETKNDMSTCRRSGHAKRRRKAWTTGKRSSQNMRKRQIKCTISLPRGFFEDAKSMCNFESKSSKKSQTRRAYTVGSNVRAPDCQSTNVWDACKAKSNFEDASGDGSRTDGFARWTKAHPSLLNIKSKDDSSKGTQRKRNLAFIDEELNCLEKEIVCSLDKYKKFLQFYSTFLHKNHRTKPLKIVSEASKFRTVSRRRTSWEISPMYMAVMKKTFREIEALQKKIKFWRDE